MVWQNYQILQNKIEDYDDLFQINELKVQEALVSWF